MGRARAKLHWVVEGKQFVVRFFHPVLRRGVRLVVGKTTGDADTCMAWLNSICVCPDYWLRPPVSVPPEIVRLWRGGVAESVPLKPSVQQSLWQARAEFWQGLAETQRRRAEDAERKLEAVLKHKIRRGPSPTMLAAAQSWIAAYKGRDPDHMQTVRWEVLRFARDMGESSEVDTLYGAEQRIEAWLRGLSTRERAHAPARPLSAGRRNQIRSIVLRFLEDSGVALERRRVHAARANELRQARGPVRWLSREQAAAMAEALPHYWSDLFRVQVGLGLRPEELITLQRKNFAERGAVLTLETLRHLTLKTGTRTILVPPGVREIFERRLRRREIVFPGAGGRPWRSARWYAKLFSRALKNAAREVETLAREHLPEREARVYALPRVDARIGRRTCGSLLLRVDARIGRRTCGSLLLRAGKSTEEVAAILGDNPKTVREHYARILSGEVDLSAAEI
jgi:hypothetical protein